MKNKIAIELWEKLFLKPKTPVFEVENTSGHQILIKRDDLNHQVVQGNKLRKLKYNLLNAINENHCTVITFGGAYSNHIVATAKAAHECGLKSIGVIRGEELEKNTVSWSETLIQARKYGMQFKFISRKQYRLKHQSEEVISLLNGLKKAAYIIPEGGSNKLAVQGVAEVISELKTQIDEPDYIFSACGTGGTLAGLIDGVNQYNWSSKVCGVPVLKAADSIASTIKDLSMHSNQVDWQLFENYHCGGYAKQTIELKEFSLKKNTNILI